MAGLAMVEDPRVLPVVETLPFPCQGEGPMPARQRLFHPAGRLPRWGLPPVDTKHSCRSQPPQLAEAPSEDLSERAARGVEAGRVDRSINRGRNHPCITT